LEEDRFGVRCTFDKPCAWKWTENLSDGFRILSGNDLIKMNETDIKVAPLTDSMDDPNGKCVNKFFCSIIIMILIFFLLR